MAENVITQVIGGTKKLLDDVNTVGDVASQMGAANMQASVNGSPESHDYELSDGDIVTFSNKPKGGL